MTRPPSWTEAEIEAVRVQRRRGVPWKQIVPPAGRTQQAAMQIFHIAERKSRAPADSPAAPLAVVAGGGWSPCPVYRHDVEIRARVAAQGPTAGILGDPPPGRSALDRRRMGLA